MDKKCLFLFNMHSGKGSVRAKLVWMIDGLNKLGYELIVYSTQQAGDAERLVMEYAPELDLVVCAGGDGTVSETIMGLQKSGRDIPLAFLPCGSTNDYAKSIGLSSDIAEAKIVSSGPIQSRN